MTYPKQTLIGIAAVDDNYGIAKQGKIPWKNPTDLMFFKAMIKDQVIIVSESTAKQMPYIFKGWCWAIIISSKYGIEEKFNNQIAYVNYAGGLHMIKHAQEHLVDKNIYLCGGAKIYQLYANLCLQFYLTKIPGDYKCDTFLDIGSFNIDIDEDFCLPSLMTEDDNIFAISQYQSVLSDILEKDHINEPDTISNTFSNLIENKLNEIHNSRKETVVRYLTLAKTTSEEELFLDLGLKCISKGKKVQTRNGLVRSIFGHQLTFNLMGGLKFPLLTTRKLFFRGIFEELMMYLRGQTNNQILVDKNINVWTANTTREFLDKQGLQHLPVGDMGNSYGFAMRHFGAEYVDCNTNYEGKGVDQLAELIKGLKEDPNSRRHIITLWNPAALKHCPLPPCLWTYQFYVENKMLSCMATQRSSDYAVAGGWNIATIALFTMLLAKTLDLIPHQIIWNIGDLHVYEDHVEGFREQAQRQIKDSPMLNIKTRKEITDYEFSDLELIGYDPHPNIPFKMLA